MSICSSGSSQPKPGIADDIVITGSFAGSLLSTVYPWLAAAIAAFTGVVELHLPTFCAADPPPDPGVTAADVLGLIAFGPDPGNSGGSGRITQAIKRAAWPALCQCTTGGTFTPLPPVSAPTGLPALNPTGVVALPNVTACRTTIPTLPRTLSQGNNPLITGRALASLNVTSVTAKVTVTAGSPSSGPWTFTLGWFHAPTGTRIVDRNDTFTVNPGSSGTLTSLKPATADQWDLAINIPVSPTGTGTMTVCEVDEYCNNDSPGGTLSQCCPPDTTTIALLQSILSMVTLIQRQAVPFGYVASTVHAGLTGTGTVAVSGILALAASVTTLPTQLAQSAGTPPRVYGLGRLSLSTSDGAESPVFLESQNQLIVPQSAGLITSVGYTLQDGAVLTLRELIREP